MRKLIDKIKSLDKGTIIRSVMLILALANQVIAVLGATSYASALWYQITSIVVTSVTALVTAWKNNDFTTFAKLSTGILHALKDGKITADEVIALLDKSNSETNK